MWNWRADVIARLSESDTLSESCSPQRTDCDSRVRWGQGATQALCQRVFIFPGANKKGALLIWGN